MKISYDAGIQEEFLSAINRGDLWLIEKLRNEVSPTIFRIGFKRAASIGKLEIVQFHCNDKRLDDTTIGDAFVNAAYNGHFGVVDSLYREKNKPSDIAIIRAFISAAYNGHLKIVEFLRNDRITNFAVDNAFKGAADKFIKLLSMPISGLFFAYTRIVALLGEDEKLSVRLKERPKYKDAIKRAKRLMAGEPIESVMKIRKPNMNQVIKNKINQNSIYTH